MRQKLLSLLPKAKHLTQDNEVNLGLQSFNFGTLQITIYTSRVVDFIRPVQQSSGFLDRVAVSMWSRDSSFSAEGYLSTWYDGYEFFCSIIQNNSTSSQEMSIINYFSHARQSAVSRLDSFCSLRKTSFQWRHCEINYSLLSNYAANYAVISIYMGWDTIRIYVTLTIP